MSITVVLLTIILNIVLGILVFARNRKNPINVYFFLLTLSISLWISTLFLYYLDFSSATVLMLGRLNFVAVIYMVLFLYKFIHFFPKEIYKEPKLVNYFLFSSAFVLTALTQFTGFVVKNEIVFGPERQTDFGGLFSLFLIYFVFLSAIIVFLFFRKLFLQKGQIRVQLGYLAFGTIVSLLVTSVSNLLLPIVFRYEGLLTMSPVFTLPFVGFTAYAIIRHKMMDIRMVVARSVSYSLLVAILAGFYAGAVLGIERLFFPESLTGFNWTQGIIRTILAVLMAFSFQPLRRWITKVTDKIFFKNAYDPEALLDDVSHTVSSTIVLVEMMYKTLQLLSKEMKVTRGIIVVLTDSGSIYTSQSIGYTVALKIDADEMVKLSKDGILLYDELDERSHYKKLLRKYDASVAVPIRTNTDCVGVLLLGEKASGDMYSQADHQIFEIIAPELAVAITNAKSFEKIEKFNVTLRQEIKKATHELEKKNDQLRELDKAKDEFISMASHQLRTPLTAIKGYLSMLLEGDAGEIKVSQYDFVNEAYQGANRMVGLINDLLNVSRMETGRFFLEPTEVDMERVAAEEVKQLLNHAKEKKLKLTLKVKGKTPRVTVDETKIRQVMMNFIDNAVYYTTEGSVTVTLEHDKKDVIFKVTDTGIGVPKEAQKNLFTKFYRADNARHVRPDGTGLGIYLAKRVMDDHHGELIFHSEEGKGSVFGFKLPIKSKITMQPASAPAPTGQAVGPAIGELAAGIGVNPKTLEATQVQNGPTVTPSSAIANGDVIASKAAGIEPPLTEGQSKS